MQAKRPMLSAWCVLAAVCFLFFVNVSTAQGGYADDLKRARDKAIMGKANMEAGRALQDAGSNAAACAKYLEAAADYAEAASILLGTNPPPNQQANVLEVIRMIQEMILEAFDRAIECCEGEDPQNCLSDEDYYVIAEASDDVIQGLDELLGTIPTLTEWGMIIFGAVLLGFITWVFLKRRKAVVSYQ